jgi:hypothetical protein
MRNNAMIRHWSMVATVTVAALGLSGLALAQMNKPGDRDATPRSMTCCMTTPQVAALVKDAKHSLADSISAAERHCNGRAVRAECCRGADDPVELNAVLLTRNRQWD